MDDDVIDLTHMPDQERRQHMKDLDRKATCPCCYCDVICDRITSRFICSRYQEWLNLMFPERTDS